MKNVLTLLLLTAFFVIGGPSNTASGQNEVVAADPNQTFTTISLILGSGMVLQLPGDMERVALADEAIASVRVLSGEEVLLNGLAIGRTTLLVWLKNGQRVHIVLQVGRDLSLLKSSMTELSPGILVEETADGRMLMLKGELDDPAIISEAERQAREILRAQGDKAPVLLNLLSRPLSPDVRLRKAMAEIDPRIRVRRIRVGTETEGEKDSYVLEGEVRNIQDLVRAIILAERQLGGTGNTVLASDNSRIRVQDVGSGFFGGSGGGQGNAAETDQPASLAAQIARGLLVRSESGRVLSFLEVDNLYQILVSIRALEVDRGKARKLGVNYRIDGRNFSLGNYTAPQGGNGFPSLRSLPASVSGIAGANLVGAYVSDTIGIATAIDFLEGKDVARSVAEPNVLTLSGEEASIVVGGRTPIPTTSLSEVAAFQGFNFQSFGVRLNIRPTVDEYGVVTMEVAPSISRPDPSLAVDGVPGFHVQSVQTTARVKAGESLIIGGLISQEESREERKIPLLGDIPLVSPLFKWKATSHHEQELLFVITPHIIKNSTKGVGDPVKLPGFDIRDTKLNEELDPVTLEPDGLPSAWAKQYDRPATPNPAAQPNAPEPGPKSNVQQRNFDLYGPDTTFKTRNVPGESPKPPSREEFLESLKKDVKQNVLENVLEELQRMLDENASAPEEPIAPPNPRSPIRHELREETSDIETRPPATGPGFPPNHNGPESPVSQAPVSDIPIAQPETKQEPGKAVMAQNAQSGFFTLTPPDSVEQYAIQLEEVLNGVETLIAEKKAILKQASQEPSRPVNEGFAVINIDTAPPGPEQSYQKELELALQEVDKLIEEKKATQRAGLRTFPETDLPSRSAHVPSAFVDIQPQADVPLDLKPSPPLEPTPAAAPMKYVSTATDEPLKVEVFPEAPLAQVGKIPEHSLFPIVRIQPAPGLSQSWARSETVNAGFKFLADAETDPGTDPVPAPAPSKPEPLAPVVQVSATAEKAPAVDPLVPEVQQLLERANQALDALNQRMNQPGFMPVAQVDGVEVIRSGKAGFIKIESASAAPLPVVDGASYGMIGLQHDYSQIHRGSGQVYDPATGAPVYQDLSGLLDVSNSESDEP